LDLTDSTPEEAMRSGRVGAGDGPVSVSPDEVPRAPGESSPSDTESSDPAQAGPDTTPRASATASPGDAEALRLEVERLKSVQKDLEDRLDKMTEARRDRHGKMRGSIIAFLAGLSCVLVYFSVVTVWVHQTVLRTDGFVSTAAPIMKRPEVARSISTELTGQLFTSVDVEAKIKQVLPAPAKFLANPLTSTARGFIRGQMENVLESGRFQGLLTAALRTTHGQVIAALRGQSGALRVSNGAVVLNLLPLVNGALARVQEASSGVLGRNITIPPVTSGEIPAEIRSRLSSALGVQLPADFAQIEVARSSSIHAAQVSVRTWDLLHWLLPLASLLLIGATLWQSPNRRRTALQMLIGTAVVFVIGRGTRSWITSRIVSSLDPIHRAAARVVVQDFLQSFNTVIVWSLVGFLVVVLLLLVTGPYPWARGMRHRTAHLVSGLVRLIGRPSANEQPAGAWIVDHHRVLQTAGAVVGGLVLWIVPGWWFVVVVVILVSYEVALWRIAAGSARERRADSAEV